MANWYKPGVYAHLRKLPPRLELIEFGPNQFIDVIWGTPDYDRLKACFDRIARGLHLVHFDQKFVGNTRAILGYTRIKEQSPAEFQRFIRDKVAQELDSKPRLGNNPDVFAYQFTDHDEFGLFVVHLQFFGRLDVFVGYLPDSSPPVDNLAMRLIDIGIPTVMKLGENLYNLNTETPHDENVG